MATQEFPTTGTMEGDIKAGYISPEGVYNPNISVNQIQPQEQFKTATPEQSFNDYNAILAGTQGALDFEEKQSSETEQAILSKMSELSGEEAYTQKIENRVGLDASRQTLNNLISQLRSVNNEAAAQTLRLDQPNRAAILTSQEGILKENIERNRTIKALGLSASIQAIQGNIDLAMDQVDRAVKLRYDPIRKQLELLNTQLNFNYRRLDSAQQKRADALKMANDERLRLLDIEQQNERDRNQAVVQLMSQYKDAGITLQDTVESANTKILNNSQSYQLELADARSLINQRNRSGSGSGTGSTQPLSILDIQRYQELYPEAGIVAGDSESTANAKVAALSQPRDFTDEQFREIIRSFQSEGATYESVLSELNSDPIVQNKDRAELIAGELYEINSNNDDGNSWLDKIGNYLFN